MDAIVKNIDYTDIISTYRKRGRENLGRNN